MGDAHCWLFKMIPDGFVWHLNTRHIAGVLFIYVIGVDLFSDFLWPPPPQKNGRKRKKRKVYLVGYKTNFRILQSQLLIDDKSQIRILDFVNTRMFSLESLHHMCYMQPDMYMY